MQRSSYSTTPCCPVALPGHKSGFRSGFRPDSNRGSLVRRASKPDFGRRGQLANICYPTLHVNPGVVGRGTYRALVAGGNPGGWRFPAGPETCTAVMVTGGVRWGRRTLLGQRLPVPRGPEPLTRADGLVSELIERVVAHWGSLSSMPACCPTPLRGARR